MEKLAQLLVEDRNGRPEGYSVCIVSEGAMPEGGEMVFMGGEKDMFGHAKLGGIGQNVSNKVKELAPGYNGGKKIDMISMNLSYLVRSGAPDAIDCIVPTAYGNLAVDLILKGQTGRMVALQGGKYGSVPIDEVVSTKKVVDVDRYYDTERYRPKYDALELSPLMVLGGSA
jgi:6-phosphofructokinase 1